jgi:hypothetical protein
MKSEYHSWDWLDQEQKRDNIQMGVRALSHRSNKSLLELIHMPQKDFMDGYIAGWRAIREAEQIPSIPAYSVVAGETPYRAGVIQGVRDARAFAPSKSNSAAAAIDDLFDRALRRAIREIG